MNIEDKTDYEKLDKQSDDENHVTERKWKQKQDLINFHETYRPYKLYQELRRLNISATRAKQIKNIYRGGAYYLIQMELESLK